MYQKCKLLIIINFYGWLLSNIRRQDINSEGILGEIAQKNGGFYSFVKNPPDNRIATHAASADNERYPGYTL